MIFFLFSLYRECLMKAIEILELLLKLLQQFLCFGWLRKSQEQHDNIFFSFSKLVKKKCAL